MIHTTYVSSNKEAAKMRSFKFKHFLDGAKLLRICFEHAAYLQYRM